MAECFTFGGRELSWATSRTRHQTSFSCCCRLLSSSCRFRSLSILSWGLSRLETKKKENTKHKTPIRAKSTQYQSFLHACCKYLQIISLTHYPVLCISALSCSRLFFIQSCCQASSHQQDVNKPNSYSKWQKEDWKAWRAFSGCTSFDRNPLHVLLGFSDNHDNVLSLHALEQRGHQSLTCSALVCSRWVLRLIRWFLHRACIRWYQSFCGS